MTFNRWTILAVLFLARLTMAFQFQAVAALSPLIAERHGLGLTEIGWLIGVYLAPGVLVAIPGGAIAAILGDKRIVALSMGLMLAGGGLASVAESWTSLMLGRALAGAGGVVINVVMTKMLVDWFEGHEISTALAIFINSWPIGIALALLVLPALAAAGGLGLAQAGVLLVIALALLCFLWVYRLLDGARPIAPTLRWLSLPAWPLLLAGLIWALYNTALAMVFSFGPVLLKDLGWSLAAAASATSAFMVALSIALPAGGFLADRTGRRDGIIGLGLLSFALLMPLIPALPAGAVMMVLVFAAAMFGLAAGPIMTLPSAILPPAQRSFGMGVFFTIYYAVMMIAPSVAGGLADRTGNSMFAIWIGVALCLICMGLLILFRVLDARAVPLET